MIQHTCMIHERRVKRSVDLRGSASTCPEELRSFQKQNCHEYQIFVHALKSTSKTIGVTTLSEQVRSLEEAAKQADADDIEKNHFRLLSEYKEIRDQLAVIVIHGR